MGKRRKAREAALKILYMTDITKEDPDEALDLFWLEREVHPEVKGFTEELVFGTIHHLSEIDHLLRECSEHWSLDRMNVVDRNILRAAIFEICFLDDIPSNVTINEAIEIAKKFGTEDSAHFVNGILDRAKREVESKR